MDERACSDEQLEFLIASGIATEKHRYTTSFLLQACHSLPMFADLEAEGNTSHKSTPSGRAVRVASTIGMRFHVGQCRRRLYRNKHRDSIQEDISYENQAQE